LDNHPRIINPHLLLFNNNLRRLLAENPNFNLLELYNVINNENRNRFISLHEYIADLGDEVDQIIISIFGEDNSDLLDDYSLLIFPHDYDDNEDHEL
jgi:hypothetical protein